MSATIIERDQIEVYRLIVLIRALAMEIVLGMPRSNKGRTTLQLLQEAGVTDKRTKKAALKQIIQTMESNNMEVPASLRMAAKK